MTTYRKVCIDAVDPDEEGPVLARALGLPWQSDGNGEGGLMGPRGQYLVWFNAVPDAAAKSERVQLDIRSRRWRAITVSSADPLGLATWWARLLEGTSRADETGTWEVAGVRGMPVPLVFQPTDEPKSAVNRLHWDVTGDPDELVRAGASLLQRRGTLAWSVLADPEGNEFCVFPEDDR